MLKVQNNYKVGIYVRLSKDDERAGESVSIENQKLLLTKYCEEQGWNDYSVYCDDGVSGTTFDRPGVSKLIEDAKEGLINLILVKDLSRFGRNYIQVGQFTDYLFPMIGCRFIALNDGVDTIHSDNDIMPFRNLFNEFQSKDTSKKIKAVKQAHAKMGNYLGWLVPYGYQAHPDDKHKFIIDEYAAGVVRKIFANRRKGWGYRKIAAKLNEEHILPPLDYYYQQKGKEDTGIRRNHLWNDMTVKKILRNEVYLGHMIQNKRGTLSYKNKKQIDKPKEDWIKVENTHEPIIDMDAWNACQEIAARNYKSRPTKDNEISLFGGLLKCMDCGFAMRYTQETHNYPKKGFVKYVSYLCGNYTRSGAGACSAHIIYLNPLAELVLNDIRHRAKRVLEDEDTLIGRCICRQGEKAFVAHLAEMLASRFPSLKGFSRRNLRRMRDFYRTYANNPALMEKAQSLGWTQNAVILECCETQEQRSFYIDLAAGQNLSKLALMKAIQENAFDALFNEESPAENGEPSFAPVSDNSLNAAVDTAASIETACEPSVPACEPLRQGDTVPRSTGRVSTAVSAEVSIGRQTKHKVDGEPPPLGFINPHQPYPPPLVLWTDKLKPPQKPPTGVQSQKKNLPSCGRTQRGIQQRILLLEQTVA